MDRLDLGNRTLRSNRMPRGRRATRACLTAAAAVAESAKMAESAVVAGPGVNCQTVTRKDDTTPPPSLRRGHPGHSPSPTTPPKLKKTPEKDQSLRRSQHGSPPLRSGKITAYFTPATAVTENGHDSDIHTVDEQEEEDLNNGDDDVITFASPEELEEEDDVEDEEDEDNSSGKENEDWRALSPRVLDLVTTPTTSEVPQPQGMPSPRSELKGAVSPSPSNNSSSSPLQPRRVTRSRAAQTKATLQNGPSTSRAAAVRASSPPAHIYSLSPSRCPPNQTPPHSPPTPHKIKLLEGRSSTEEQEQAAKKVISFNVEHDRSDTPETPPSENSSSEEEEEDDVITSPPPPNGLQKARRDLTRFLLAKAESEPTTGPKTRLPSSPTENGDSSLENGDLSNHNCVKKEEVVEVQATLPGHDQKSNQTKTASVTRKVTDFFQIRRSSRKPKTEIEAQQQSEIDAWLEKGQACNDSACGIGIQTYEGKGRGIEARKHFKKGDFVVEYAGELMPCPAAAKEREDFYAADAATGCYMYYFKHGDKQYCIDATSESGRLGRLVNHSRLAPNCQTKVVMVRDLPRLILVAKTDIEPGTELLYDYGDRSKESLRAHPWLAL